MEQVQHAPRHLAAIHRYCGCRWGVHLEPWRTQSILLLRLLLVMVMKMLLLPWGLVSRWLLPPLLLLLLLAHLLSLMLAWLQVQLLT